MPDPNPISTFLDELHEDWRDSRYEFPLNTIDSPYRPIPFFGNPATALIATVGVNPSSSEFTPGRGWSHVQTMAAWKKRLRDYFKSTIPPREWFDPWRIGLELLGMSYERGTATHLDGSYRPTSAMIKNPNTNREEFRRMVERDVAWFFRLLLLCPNLRVLLTFGPIIAEGPRPEGLFGFLFTVASKHGFKMVKQKEVWELWHEPTKKIFLIHDADSPIPGEKCVTCRVVKNLYAHRDELRERLVQRIG
jgi:hypothetical protein